MDRAPITEGKEAQTLEWDGAKIALPKPVRKIKPDSGVPPQKLRSWGGDRIETGKESTVGFSNDPPEIVVSELPKRDSTKK